MMLQPVALFTIVIFDCHFWMSFLNVIFECHFWLSFLIVIFFHFLLSFSIIFYCHFWLSFLIVIFDCHFWLSFLIVIFDCHFWLSFLITFLIVMFFKYSPQGGALWVKAGSAITNGREPRSCLGWVFNSKLGCFATPGRQCIVWRMQPLLKLKTRPKARPVS